MNLELIRIPDALVEHVWVPDPGIERDSDEDTDESEPVAVSPDFYQDSGTPIDSNGEDMVYSHTVCPVFGKALDLLERVTKDLRNFLTAYDGKHYHPGWKTIAEIQALMKEVDDARG